MELVINEKQLLKNCIDNKKLLNDISLNYFINLLIRNNKEMKNKELCQYILDVLKEIDLDDYKKNQEYLIYKRINNNIIKERKYDNFIREKDYVYVTDKEVELIKTLKTDREKKFIFTCYAVARLLNKDGWIGISLKDLFQMSNISMKNEDMQKFIFKLKQQELLYEPIKSSNSSLHIELIDGEEEIKVYKMKNLGNQILAYLKPNYKQCEICGKLIRIKSNRQLYCESCYNKIHDEDTKNRMRRYREKANVTF